MSKKKPFAKKSLGQNFLVDQNIVDKIIQSLSPQNNETIIEIGAGRGALTEKICENAEKVLAIEVDQDLVPILQSKFGQYDNFYLIEKDALEIDYQSLVNLQSHSNTAKLVANLPYYISTAILQHLIQHRFSFTEMVLMLQREVVERITAKTGKKKRGYLTVLIEAYFYTEKLFDVPPNAFRPKPKVTSSIVRLMPKLETVPPILNENLFKEIISLCFMQKRKTLLNNLKNAKDDLSLMIEKLGGIDKVLARNEIESRRRAESLELNEWIKLVNHISEN